MAIRYSITPRRFAEALRFAKDRCDEAFKGCPACVGRCATGVRALALEIATAVPALAPKENDMARKAACRRVAGIRLGQPPGHAMLYTLYPCSETEMTRVRQIVREVSSSCVDRLPICVNGKIRVMADCSRAKNPKNAARRFESESRVLLDLADVIRKAKG